MLGRPRLEAELLGHCGVVGDHDVVEVVVVVHRPDLDGRRVDLAEVGQRRVVLVVRRVGDLLRPPDALLCRNDGASRMLCVFDTTVQTTPNAAQEYDLAKLPCR